VPAQHIGELDQQGLAMNGKRHHLAARLIAHVRGDRHHTELRANTGADRHLRDGLGARDVRGTAAVIE
jgi:hypothetical protein